jgi:hypothetical protein
MVDAVIELFLIKIGLVLLGGVVLIIIVVLFCMVIASILKESRK